MSLMFNFSKSVSRFLGILICILCTNNSFGQIIQQMTNILPPDVITCSTTFPVSFGPLNAVYPPSISLPAVPGTGSGYAISNIAIENTVPSGQTVSLQDDAFGVLPNGYPIGFQFNFFGVNYTRFYISANGYIGFTPPLPITYDFDACGMNNMASLCAAGNNFPKNAIFGYFQDFNPAGNANRIRYETTGTVGNRILTVYFSNLPFFSTCTGVTSSFRIKIFETTNNIEVHINNKPGCPTMYPGNDGFSGVVPPCSPIANNVVSYTHGGNDQTISNVAFRYTPSSNVGSSPSIAYVSNVSWSGINGDGSSFNITSTTNTVTGVSLNTLGQAPKKYIIKVKYDVPCSTNDIVYVDTFVIRRPIPIATITPPGPTSFCPGGNVVLNANTGSGFNYQWQFNGVNIPGPLGTAASYTASAVGNYTVEVSSPCVASSSITTVNVNPLPIAVIATPATSTIFCTGGNVVLNANPNPGTGVSYQWKLDGVNILGATASSYTASASGLYTVVVTNTSTSCSATSASLTVTVNTFPSAVITPAGPTTFCEGGSVLLNANTGTGFTYQWKLNGTNILGPLGTAASYTASMAGSYTVVVSSPCSTTSSATIVTVNPLPTAPSITPSGPTTFCAGDNVDLIANAATGLNYQWKLGGVNIPGATATATSYTASASGDYTVEVINPSTLCSATSSATTITVNALPSAVITPAGPTTFCFLGSVVLNANIGTGLNYQWKLNGAPLSGATASSYTANESGSYTVEVTNAGPPLCSATSIATTVTVNPLPSAAIIAAGPTTFCFGGNVILNANTGTGLSYQWKLNGNNIIGATAASYTANASGIYTVVVTNSNLCSATSNQIPITVNPIPTATFTVPSGVCPNLDVLVDYIDIGSVSATASFLWSFDGGNATQIVPNNNDSYNVNWSTSGTKTITLSVTDLGCTSLTNSMNVEVFVLPLVDAGSDIEVCSGAIVPIGTTGVLAYTYLWTPAFGITDPTQSNSTIQLQNNTPDTQTYQFTLTASNGQCSNSDAMLFSITSPPAVEFNVPLGQCFEGNSFDFEAVGEFTSTASFIWNFGPNANVATSSLINPSNISFNTWGSQNVTLQVNDAGCFSNLFMSNVQVYDEPNANFEAEVPWGCVPLKVNYINMSSAPSSQMNYTWNFGIGNTSSSLSPSYNYDDAGVYSVSLSVETPQGCSDMLSMDSLVHVFPMPTPGFLVDRYEATILDPNITFTSNAYNADSAWYVISTGDTLYGFNQYHSFPDSAGVYSIMQYVTNQYACSDSIDRSITITTGYKIFIPTNFTPNGDDLNEFFKPFGEGIKSYYVVIFNRWGQQVYASYDSENGWDGKDYSGNKALPGEYFYRINLVDERNYSQQVEGVISLMY